MGNDERRELYYLVVSWNIMPDRDGKLPIFRMYSWSSFSDEFDFGQ